METTNTMEALNASAETANEAAETALLATESIIALSSKVSDDVRSAVQEAIESATPPSTETQAIAAPVDNSGLVDELRGAVQQAIESAIPATAPAAAALDSSALINEISSAVQQAVTAATPKTSVMDAVMNGGEEEKKSPLEHAPLIVAALTLGGVGYLSMLNSGLSEELTTQQQQLSAIEEQLQSNVGESGSQIMLLAEQNQRVEEAIHALAAKPATTDETTTEKSAEMVALEQVSSQLNALQLTLEQIQMATADNSAAKTTAAEEVATTHSNVTLEGIRSTLQQELTPLHNSIKLVEQRLQTPLESPVVSIPLQPIQKELPTFERKQSARTKQDKPRVYRFP